jgi:hypothetical protein
VCCLFSELFTVCVCVCVHRLFAGSFVYDHNLRLIWVLFDVGLLLGALALFVGWYMYYSELFRRYDVLPNAAHSSEPLLSVAGGSTHHRLSDTEPTTTAGAGGGGGGELYPALKWNQKFVRLVVSYSVVLLCLACSAFVIVHAFESWKADQFSSTVLRALLTTSINLTFPVIATRLTLFQQ